MTPGQRVEGFRFLVEDPDGFEVGEVHPVVGGTLDLQTTRGVMRTMTNFTVVEGEFAAINPVRHLVRPYAVVGDVEYPLGLFRFATDSIVHVGHEHTTEQPSGKNFLQGNLSDLSMILDQPTGTVLSTSTSSARDAVIELLEHAPSFVTESMNVEGNTTLVDPQAWPPETTLLQAVNEVCVENDYYPLHFDRHGTLQIRRQVDVDSADPIVDWSVAGSAVEGIVVTRDFLQTPTRWLVISSNENSGPVTGEYRLPVSHPMSSAERGFEVTKVISTQGVTSQTHADQVARFEAGVDPDATEQLSLSTPLDPMHDVFDVVAYDGRHWLERGWSMELTAGGAMRHDADRQLVVDA